MTKQQLTKLIAFFIAVNTFNIAFSKNDVHQEVDSLLLSISDLTSDTTKAKVYQQVAILYQNLDDYSLALQYASQSNAIAKRYDFKYVKLQNFNTLQKSYKKLGDSRNAIHYLKEMSALTDTIKAIEQAKKAQELEQIYQVKQKNLENQVLKKEKEKTIQNRKITQNLIIMLILMLLLVTGWIFIIYESLHQKRTINEQLEDKVKARTEELHEINYNLERVNYELKVLNTAASNEMKQPVQNIDNFVQLLETMPVELREEIVNDFDQIKESASQLQKQIENISAISQISEEEKAFIDDIASSDYEMVLNIMEQQKLYLNPELTLFDLASICDFTPKKLSYIINHNTKNNFNHFINHYRVKEAQKMLKNEEYSHYSTLGIGFEVGFKSKASYYSVFKQITGTTPGKFRKQS